MNSENNNNQIDVLPSINELDTHIDLVSQMAISYIPRIVWALLVVWIGFKISNGIVKLLRKVLSAEKIDTTVEKFLWNLATFLLKWIVIIAAAGMIWVQTASFIALLWAIGLAIGLSLSGTLWNFASGLVILLFKTYRVWDWVEISDHFGKVIDISIFFTDVRTVDGRDVIIPNSEATSTSMINYSLEDKKRLDIDIGISYSDSIDKARDIMIEIWKSHDKILMSEPMNVVVVEMADNSVILQFRAWVRMDDYIASQFAIREQIKKEFDAKWVTFPFPQRDVYMYDMGKKKSD